MSERISAAAIEHNGKVVSLPPPARHHTIIMELSAAEELLVPVATPALVRGRQGFLTSTGRFVTREEARDLAIRSGQCPQPRHGTMLFSEDLW